MFVALGLTFIAVGVGGVVTWNALRDHSRNRQCGDVDGITDRRPIDVDVYGLRNEQLAQTLPRPAGAVIENVEHRPYDRCPDGMGGDVVGVTSIVRMRLRGPSDKCTVVAALEADLRGDGWTLDATETGADGGTARSTHAYRGTERLEVSINPAPVEYVVFVDHDSPHPTPENAGSFDFPCG